MVRIQSPPVEGAANDELIQVLAKTFGVAKRDVSLVAGEHSRLKRVALGTMERSRVDAILESLGIDPRKLTVSP